MRKRVTIKDLAQECNVSTATVSRVLNDKPGNYSAETELLIRNAAERMGYFPNRMARALITNRTNLIALLVPDIHYYFYQDFYTGVDNYFSRFGYRVLLCITQENAAAEKEFLSELSNGQVDGIIVSTLNKREDNSEIVNLASEKFPIVTLERYGKELKGVTNVRIDNRLAAKLAVNYLYKNNHKHIAFLKGHPEANNGELRYQGYLDAMRAKKLSINEKYTRQADYLFEPSITATHDILTECPEVTAIIAANDLMAMGACKAISQAKKRVPYDISVVGLGEAILTYINEPSLTTVNFHPEQLGETAADELFKQINGKFPSQEDAVLHKPILSVQESVRYLT